MDKPNSPQKTPRKTRWTTTRRRQSARVTRLIQLLRAHGMLAKVPRSRRYRVTANGERLFGSAIYMRYKHLPKDLSDAA